MDLTSSCADDAARRGGAVYILAGQSNMAGRASAEGVQLDSSVRMRWCNGNKFGPDRATSDGFVPLQAQPSCNPGAPDHVGPEATLTPSLALP